MRKKKNDVLENIWEILLYMARPLIGLLTGLGMFFWYFLFDYNIWVCIVVGMYISSLIGIMTQK